MLLPLLTAAEKLAVDAALKKVLDELITNDDQPANWFVVVYATKRQVNEFQCRTEADVLSAVRALRHLRASRGLPTARATRRQLLGGRGRNKLFGPVVEIKI